MRLKYYKRSEAIFVSRINPVIGGGYRRCPWSMTLAENKLNEVMMPKFQKQRVLKLAGRIIPGASRRGI
jgi:hypothetical protein